MVKNATGIINTPAFQPRLNASLGQPAGNPAGSVAEQTRAFVFGYNQSDSAQRQEEVIARLQELDPLLTRTQLDKLGKNPVALETLLALKEKQHKLAKEDEIRHKQASIGSTVGAVSAKVHWLLSDAIYYAKRNFSSRAIQLALAAKPTVQSGMEEVSGLSGEDVSLFVTSALSVLSAMESTAHDSYLKVLGIQLTDYDLLKLTGLDSQGRTEQEHKQQMLANMPRATTPLSTFQSELAALSPQTNSPAGIQNLSNIFLRQDSFSSANGR